MLTKKQIVEKLRELGLKTGDKVLLHSSTVSLGEVKGGPKAVLDAFLEVLGASGTLLVPIFGRLGILTDLIRDDPRAVKSPCPVGTVAAIGADAEALCHDHWTAETAHGVGTPFHRLGEMGGYVCLLGVDQDRNTLLHGIEAMLQLPYLNSTTRTFTLPNGKEVTKEFKYYPGPHRNFIGLDHRLRAAGALKELRLGNAEVRLMSAKELWRLGMEWGKEDPAFVLCDNPACADCVKQHAAIARDSFARESFRLAMSSRLAGRYVPEMIENLQACGIDLVELDYIQGKSVAQFPSAKLSSFVQEFTDAKITVESIRLDYLPADLDTLARSMLESGVLRLVLPLITGAETICKQLEHSGLELEFTNVALGGTAFRELQKQLADQCGVRFNPVNFVRAGEMPFLCSYGAGRFIRTMTSLDVNDALWDGPARRLAQGNAEIKELVSIVRCRNFAGTLVLGGGAPCATDARQFCQDFEELLATI
ncbi:MAG: AAC(3) family N-acetyltransferase [Victivallales bacterium]|nr:AAC(3) family N-acetyltransferase [Victivallales bacterium]